MKMRRSDNRCRLAMSYRLPPLNALRAFEASARHLSFNRAADELCVTAGAVSQQVKILEARTGAKLFRPTVARAGPDRGRRKLPAFDQRRGPRDLGGDREGGTRAEWPSATVRHFTQAIETTYSGHRQTDARGRLEAHQDHPYGRPPEIDRRPPRRHASDLIAITARAALRPDRIADLEARRLAKKPRYI